jgi:hypothetical protein
MSMVDLAVWLGAAFCGLAVAVGLTKLRARLGGTIEIEVLRGRSRVRLLDSPVEINLENVVLCEGEGPNMRITDVGSGLSRNAPELPDKTRAIDLESVDDDELATAAWEAFILHCVHRARIARSSRRWSTDKVRVVLRQPGLRSILEKTLDTRNRSLLPSVEVVDTSSGSETRTPTAT